MSTRMSNKQRISRAADEAEAASGNHHTNGVPIPGTNGKLKIAKPEDKAAELAAETWKPIGEAIKKLRGNDDKLKLLAMKRDDFEEVYGVMDTLVAEHHPHLVEAEAEIALIWLLTPSYSSGKLILGRAQRAATMANALAGLVAKKNHRDFNFVISLDAGAWERLAPDQREAVMDHLLCHCFCELKEQDPNGNAGWQWKIRRHDIEEFTEVVQRHGLYMTDLQEFVEVARDAALPNLFTSPEEAQEPEAEEATA